MTDGRGPCLRDRRSAAGVMQACLVVLELVKRFLKHKQQRYRQWILVFEAMSAAAGTGISGHQ